MSEKRDPAPREEASRPEEGEAAFVKERELKDDGRYIIFYNFGDEEGEAD